MWIDIAVSISLVVIFVFLIRRNAAVPTFSAISLLIVAFSSRAIVSNLSSLFIKNGLAKESYATLMVFLLIVVLAWGILYALLANLRSPLERLRLVSSIITSLLMAGSLGLIACNASTLSLTTQASSSAFCRACSLTTIQNKNVLLSSDSVEEVVDLPTNYALLDKSLVAENEIFSKINQERTKQGIQPLAKNEKLGKLAANYSQQIVSSLRFSHLDKNKQTPADRADSLAINYTYLGENLAIASDIGSAHNALMNSRSHRNNILSAKFKKIGIAAYSLTNDSIILVEEFSD